MSDKTFRRIKPSFNSDSSKSSSNNQSTPDSGSSEIQRRNSEVPKQRKAPESITRNACLNCKKARAKCDGRTPCKRCATRVEDNECIYEIHIKHAKEELVKQIKHLQMKNFLGHQIFQSLAAEIRVPEILDMLKNGESHESIVKSIGRTTTVDPDELSPLTSHASLATSDHEMTDVNSQTPRWTSVTNDKAVLDHLFQLYFAWIHPVHALFDEGQFVNSYHNGNRYCSPILMNALCAMACHLHTKGDDDVVDYAILGEEFIEAVRDLMDPEDYRITTIQAFAVLFLVESARGNGIRAASYLRVATACLPRVEMQDRDGAPAVWRSTVQGVQNLNVEWAQVTFQVPSRIDLGAIQEDDGSEALRDDASWHFYSHTNDQVGAWPSLQATISREKSKLISIIEDVTVALYSQQGPQISAQQILEFYGRFVNWRSALPAVIGNMETNKSQALPHGLSLLILFSNSVVQLLRPLLSFTDFPSHLIEDVIWRHAQKGIALLDEQYRVQFTCRYQPVLQMYSLLHFVDVLARFFPGGIEGRCKDGPEAVKAGMEMLEESVIGFSVARLMQAMLRRTADSCSIRFPATEPAYAGYDENENKLKIKKQYQMDDFIRACTRPSYVQPVEEIRQRFLPSLIDDWLARSSAFGFLEQSAWERGGAGQMMKARRPSSLVTTGEEMAPQGLMQISNLLNSI